MHSASHKIKILSGTMSGVEYTLHAGDTVFRTGPHRNLTDGVFGRSLAEADNVFYLPDEAREEASILVRVTATDPQVVELAACAAKEAPQYRPVALNVVLHAAGVYLAVRAEADRWTSEVLDFRVPEPTPPPAGSTEGKPKRGPLVAGIAIALLGCLVAAGYWAVSGATPEVKISGLAGLLSAAPLDYEIAYGRDGQLYAFSDSAEGVTWGERAARRALREGDTFLERSKEAKRLGMVLESAGIDHVVVRLTHLARPEVVLSGGTVQPALRDRVRKLLVESAPYIKDVDVSSISDLQLVNVAGARLQSLGISSKVEASGGRLFLTNDAFLDDASLHAMSKYAEEFNHTWGNRRVTISIRLWDDLLKGRSYQYSSSQLISVGDGRWDFFGSEET